jgi:hypothetical protein
LKNLEDLICTIKRLRPARHPQQKGQYQNDASMAEHGEIHAKNAP